MDERMQFVTRRLAGEAMAELCREFGISRKTGYKIFAIATRNAAFTGLLIEADVRIDTRISLTFQVENYGLNVKREHPSWGARKIRERLIRRFSGIAIPAKITIHAVLDRRKIMEQMRAAKQQQKARAASS